MNNDTPLVSVNIPTYNRLEKLKQSIDSVLAQTYKNFEIVIIDDYSLDGTKNYLLELSQKNKKVKYIRHLTNMGLANARNTGIKNSIGELIAFLDDDDMWLPEKLEKQIDFINKMGINNFICYTSIIKKTTDNTNITQLLTPPKSLYPHLLEKNGFLFPSTIIIPKKIIVKAGMWDTKFTRGIDSDLYRRLVFFFSTDLIFLNKPLTIYNTSGDDRITNFNSMEGITKHLDNSLLTLKKYKSVFKQYPSSERLRKKEIFRTLILLIFKHPNFKSLKYFMKIFNSIIR